MRRRVISVLILVSLVLVMISGCGEKEKNNENTTKKNNYAINSEFDVDNMLTIKGVTISLTDEAEKYDTHKQNGYAYRIPEILLDLDGIQPYEWDEYGYEVDYFPEETMVKYYKYVDGEYDESEEDAIRDEILAEAMPIYGFFRYDDIADKSAMDEDFSDFKAAFTEIEELASIDTDTFYFGCNREYNREGLTDADIENLNALIAAFDEIRDSVCLFPPTELIDDFKVDLSAFNCVDLDGNEIDQSILADYDVTMINCWTTWCTYCIDEMPELAVLNSMLPENYNVITICFDADEQGELAKSLLMQTGASAITTLVANEELNDKVGAYLVGFPTTFFVNKSGKIIGSLEIGAPTGAESISKAYLELINKAYEDVK